MAKRKAVGRERFGRGPARASPCSKHIVQTAAHKLRHTINALLRDHQPYRDPQINYEQVVMDRNAPRWLCKLMRYGYLPPAGTAPDAKRPFPAGRKPTEGPQFGVALNARFL